MSSAEYDPILKQVENQGLNKEEKPLLTPQKIEILKLAAAGETNRGIGRKLGISEQTVKSHFTQRYDYGLYPGIYERLGVYSKTAAVVEAIRMGILNLEEVKIKITKPEEIPEERLHLTQLDLRILILTARGYTNSQISKELNEPLRSIKNLFSHRFIDVGRSGIFEKLSVPSSRTAAVVRALQLGIIALDVEEKPLLTDRQIEILKEAAKGRSNLEIGDALWISWRTVAGHFSRQKRHSTPPHDGIFARLNVCTRREAVVKAVHLRILDPEKFVREEELEKLTLLTEREMEVLSCLADPSLPSFKTIDREIADKLGDISRYKVRRHLESIYEKLELKELSHQVKGTRAAVIFLAFQRKQESIFPYHERLHGQNGVGGW